MSQEKDFQCLDKLLAGAFGPSKGGATPGFEARVMARIMAAREPSVWELLREAAKPLLVSGWLAAAILGVLTIKGLHASSDYAMAAIMNGDAVTRWLVL